ncbi:AIG2 family protein [Desulfobulbus propionicus DSM 2032]|uniref:Gamma-glutamylcyclotransferase family protein n=1 Tax=Desulfobulbus propionicus (strain ATCC 33891 / DSM 2032 / VKM B-1956 / 1pr3) TaxID=577650 RepID=A0A7U3YLX7_DESPD|nr:gamma-glutamylcyclotransferase family protein [Desulfobulbus propionicus]ADW17795.1 AIG2 family protein [Desulfobulbus propionicus DSM 2032]
MNQFLFVYGTLKQGFPNHSLMKGAYCIGAGHTARKFAMYKHVVPYVIKGQAVTHIHGEVYSIHPSMLETLDLFEGNPVWNCRELVDVVLDADASQVSAWMYFSDTAVGDLVESGVYTRD